MNRFIYSCLRVCSFFHQSEIMNNTFLIYIKNHITISTTYYHLEDNITYLWYTDSDDAKAKSPETTTPKTSKTIKANAIKQADMVVEEARISALPDPNSLEHLMTHLPKHPDCRACQIAKMKASHCRRVPHENKEKITKFGQESPPTP